jgi:hypothetical protein
MIPIRFTDDLPVNDDTETCSLWKRFNTDFSRRRIQYRVLCGVEESKIRFLEAG